MVLLESRRLMKPFGWGDQQVHFEAIGQANVRQYLREKFKVEVTTTQPRAFELGQVSVKTSKLPEELLSQFKRLLGPERVSVADDLRARFSGGRSYRDLISLRSLSLAEVPDVVLLPQTADHLPVIMTLAQEHQIALIPFAGGTSVVGGLDAALGQQRYVAAVDMTALNQVLDFDEESRLITVGAGIYGPDLEAYLNQRGYTLGHFPQSFEYTTLGGWVSARSSGQNSIMYGSIDKLVFSLSMVTPAGVITTAPAPNLACGPDIKHVLIGSEGIFGMVVACTLKFQPRPAEKDYFAYAFRNFADASAAARAIVQSDLRPAMVRVGDEAETESMLALGSSGSAGLFKKAVRKIGIWQLQRAGFAVPRIAMMTIGFEGSQASNRQQRQRLAEVLKGHAYKDLGRKPGEKWLKDRFKLPYARDAFMDQNLLVDTFETATTWKNRATVYQAVQKAMAQVCGGEQRVPFTLFCHLSHIYPAGTSLYFTIICQQQGDALSQWAQIKDAASQAITGHGGVISHHHGVGRDHRAYLPWSETEREVWQAVKRVLDPHAIMNPGKLLL